MTLHTYIHTYSLNLLDQKNIMRIWTHNLKFEPWRAEAEHATSQSQRLPIVMSR